MSASLNSVVRNAIVATLAGYYPVAGGQRAKFIYAVRKGGKIEDFLVESSTGQLTFKNGGEISWQDRWFDYAIGYLESGKIKRAARCLVQALKREGDEEVFSTKEAFARLRTIAA